MHVDVEALTDPARRDAAAAELHDRLRRGLGRSFGRRLSEPDLDDLAQRAVHKALTHLDRFEGRSKLTTWAMSIATREALQELRSRRHREVPLSAAIEAGATAVAPQPGLERQQVHDLLRRGIDTVLSEGQREALLAELGGFPLAEIAARQGRSRGALYKSLHDARKKLRAWLLDHGITPEDL